MAKASADEGIALRVFRKSGKAAPRRAGSKESKKGIALYDLTVFGEVVYVGVTANPATRLESHRVTGRAHWFFELSVVCWYPSRAAALIAEKERILALKPRLNSVHASRYVVGRVREIALDIHDESGKRFHEALTAECDRYLADVVAGKAKSPFDAETITRLREEGPVKSKKPKPAKKRSKR